MFPASMRITKKDFLTIRPRIIYRGSLFDVAFQTEEFFKIACVISKKRIKLATKRNSVRRKILAQIREHTQQNPLLGYYIVYPKKECEGAESSDLHKEILKAFATLQTPSSNK